MSFLSKEALIARLRRSKKSRDRLVSSNLAKTIAYQIRATRKERDWTKAKLADEAGMTPNNFSRLEDPDYGKHTITSLQRLASALDVALVVRFVPFSQYVKWLSGTPFLDEGLRPEALAVPSFEKEEQDGVCEIENRYWSVQVTPDAIASGIQTVNPKLLYQASVTPLIEAPERIRA